MARVTHMHTTIPETITPSKRRSSGITADQGMIKEILETIKRSKKRTTQTPPLLEPAQQNQGQGFSSVFLCTVFAQEPFCHFFRIENGYESFSKLIA